MYYDIHKNVLFYTWAVYKIYIGPRVLFIYLFMWWIAKNCALSTWAFLARRWWRARGTSRRAGAGRFSTRVLCSAACERRAQSRADRRVRTAQPAARVRSRTQNRSSKTMKTTPPEKTSRAKDADSAQKTLAAPTRILQTKNFWE